MKQHQNNIYRVLTSLSVLAVLAPVTGNNKWLVFLSFLAFFTLIKVNFDERMRNNLARATRNGYFAALFCLCAILMLLNKQPAYSTLSYVVQISVALCTIITGGSFAYYEKAGK